MPQSPKYLVVGGDSLVGREVFQVLKEQNKPVISTTRRLETVNSERIYLDFSVADSYRVPDTIEHAFVIAAATDYTRCEEDPMAVKVNVEFIPMAIQALLRQGIFVSYISTNSVFGGEQAWPNEDAPHFPGIAYAQQKSDSEKVLADYAQAINAQDGYQVIRLTKILDLTTPPLPNWLESWNKGEVVTPFADLIFAPMSRQFVSQSIVQVGETQKSGDFHLSGAENISYVDLAHLIAQKVGVSAELIKATTAVEKGVHIAFKPKYSGLGMARTTRLCNIEPQHISSVIDDIF